MEEVGEGASIAGDEALQTVKTAKVQLAASSVAPPAQRLSVMFIGMPGIELQKRQLNELTIATLSITIHMEQKANALHLARRPILLSVAGQVRF